MRSKVAYLLIAVVLFAMLAMPVAAKPPVCSNDHRNGACPYGQVCQVTGSHTVFGTCHSCGGIGWCNHGSCHVGQNGYQSCDPHGWCNVGYQTVTTVDDYGCVAQDPCEGITCGAGEECQSGNCVAVSCPAVPCAAGFQCEANECVQIPPQCTSNDGCATGEVCADGRCVVDPTISGTKFFDSNNNGVFDANEVGISGWDIELRLCVVDAGSPTGYACSLSATATTDASGNYKFENLLPGGYQVMEVQQDGWVKTKPIDWGYGIMISPGEVDIIGVNFGNYKPDFCMVDTDCAGDKICQAGTCVDPCAGVTCDAGMVCDAGACVDDPAMMTISGYKYNDLNSNGMLDDGEVGVADYEIRVYNVATLVGSATTDANGFYSIVVPTIAVPTPENHYDVMELLQAEWVAVNPPATANPLYAGHCLFIVTTDVQRDFFNHFNGYVPECTVDADCAEGFVCQDGTCVEAPPVDPCEGVVCDTGFTCVDGECVGITPVCVVSADCPGGQECIGGTCVLNTCETDADCEVFNHGSWKCIDGVCRDPPPTKNDHGGFIPYSEPACQAFINNLRPMDDIDPATLPVLDLHDTYVSAAFKYASQLDCMGIVYYPRGEPSYNKDCTAVVWYNREQTQLHSYGSMQTLTAPNPAQAFCVLAVKNSPTENSLPVEITLTDMYGTKVAPIISSDPVIWQCYALNDEFNECRMRESYDPFQTWMNRLNAPVIVTPIIVEPTPEPVVDETENTFCRGLEICDEFHLADDNGEGGETK